MYIYVFTDIHMCVCVYVCMYRVNRVNPKPKSVSLRVNPFGAQTDSFSFFALQRKAADRGENDESDKEKKAQAEKLFVRNLIDACPRCGFEPPRGATDEVRIYIYIYIYIHTYRERESERDYKCVGDSG